MGKIGSYNAHVIAYREWLASLAGPTLVCNETAYGSTVRLSFAIKCF